MRQSHYNPKAGKQAVSLTLNADLVAKVKAAGVNASQVAEDALAEALAKRMAEQIREEIRRDIAECNAYIAEHGSPAELVRAHYAERDDAV